MKIQTNKKLNKLTNFDVLILKNQGITDIAEKLENKNSIFLKQ